MASNDWSKAVIPCMEMGKEGGKNLIQETISKDKTKVAISPGVDGITVKRL